LAVLAKIITLLSLSGIFIWAGLVWLFSLLKSAKSFPPTQATSIQEAPQSAIRNPQSAVPNPQSPIPNPQSLIALAVGLILPFALWELVHLIILTRLAGFDMYLRQAQQRITFILDDGSGLGLQIYSGWEFFWDKFFLLAEVTHPQRWVVAIIFAAIFGGGPILLWQWRNQPGKQNLFAPLWLGWLANTIWFVSLAKTGWPRHFWFGLVLAVMLLSVMTVVWLRRGFQSKDSPSSGLRSIRHFDRAGHRLSLGAGLLLLVLLGWSFASQPHVRGFFLPDEIVPYWREKQINNKYHASLPWIIIPRAAQREVVDYIKQMPPEARIYYPDRHKSAEIPPQTGRLHYPLARRNYTTPNQADIVLIGPSVISPWQDPVRQQELLAVVERECPRPALKNDFYMICPIEENLAQTR
jgi:hypothetical protein